VSSERDIRQRDAARAKLERDMAVKVEAARRKRLRNSRIGVAVAGGVVLVVIAWVVIATVGGGGTNTNPSATAASGCTWYPSETDSRPTTGPSTEASPAPTKAAAELPPTDPPRTGYQVITFNTNLGPIKVEMNLGKTPCTAASMANLIKQKYYDGTQCHRSAASIFALQCGDPTASGSGGPGYSFADENLQQDKLPAYHEGDVAMAHTQAPNSNGGQFFFLWQTTPLPGDYSLWGKVIEGLDIVKQVGGSGDDGAFSTDGTPGDGHPLKELKFDSVTVSEISATSAVQPTTPPATATPTTTAS
jgi:peptidyl-prolyl cis-trans isomerase B (cyclophilin B)